MKKIAIVGASGYAARELFEILLNHPEARVTVATSRRDEAPRVEESHPSLAGRISLECTPFDADRIAAEADLAFLALPHTASLEVVPALRSKGVKVIDLSADYRIKNAQVYEQWYGHAHTDPAGLAEAIYGLPELFRDRIPAASLIANPGCYTSAGILGLAPLVAEGLVDPKSIIIDAMSGVSGAGRAPKPNLHFPECNESVVAYSVGNHRHTPEIEHILSEIGSETVETLFTPHLMPMDRGINATIHAEPRSPVAEASLVELYRSFYHASPFIRVCSRIPATKDSARTNFCDVAPKVVRGRIIIFSCLDNLIKGAAGVAVQNMNLMFGYPETTGFWRL